MSFFERYISSPFRVDWVRRKDLVAGARPGGARPADRRRHAADVVGGEPPPRRRCEDDAPQQLGANRRDPGRARGAGSPPRSTTIRHNRRGQEVDVEKAFGLEIPQSLAEACDPRKLALLVYDMQVGILRQLEDPSAVTARVLETLETARGAGVRVFFLRHLSLPVELAGVFQLRPAMAWQRVTRAADVRPCYSATRPGSSFCPSSPHARARRSSTRSRSPRSRERRSTSRSATAA